MYHRRSQGFTLVELLIVIAILGILAGLLAYGVSAARTAILKRAQKFEIEMIAQAIEQYRTKYGDYPPDGSSWPIMEAHLRKAFPNILITELNLLNPANAFGNTNANANIPIINDNDTTGTHPLGGRVMDSAEALVFFLGGFSSDPQRPITGPGGPFKSLATNGLSFPFVYNTQRENSFFEFKSNRLTLAPDGTVSSDEQLYGETKSDNTPLPPDLLPVYVGAGPSIQQGGVPLVYFDSRTYQLAGGYANFYVPGNVLQSENCARPFLSNEINNTVSVTIKPQRYANEKTFQIMNAGYDKLYGCKSVKRLLPPFSERLILFAVPGGAACRYEAASLGFVPLQNPTGATYYLEEFANLRPVDDNTSNFTEAPTLGESL